MSTPVTTLRIVTRTYATVAATYDTYRAGPAQPDVYAHLYRMGLRVHWSITNGRNGETLDSGSAWTRDGAVGNATTAAHRPNLGRGAR